MLEFVRNYQTLLIGILTILLGCCGGLIVYKNKRVKQKQVIKKTKNSQINQAGGSITINNNAKPS